MLEISDLDRGLVGTAPAGNMATNRKGDTYNVYSVFTGSNGSGIGLSKLPNGSLTTTNWAFLHPPLLLADSKGKER